LSKYTKSVVDYSFFPNAKYAIPSIKSAQTSIAFYKDAMPV